MNFYDWLARSPSAAEREVACRTFYRFYLGSFYIDGLFNCDPHPGNYIFLEDGRVVFLDYGCSRPFTQERREAWIACARAVRGDVPAELEQAGRRVASCRRRCPSSIARRSRADAAPVRALRGGRGLRLLAPQAAGDVPPDVHREPEPL
jgi:hypothetical protein